MSPRHHHHFLAVAAISLSGLLPYAHSQTQAEIAAQAKLAEAAAELDVIRSEISAVKVPLASRLRTLENEVLELRRERDRMQRLVDNSSVDMSSLEAQAKAFEEEAVFAVNTLNDILNRTTASINVSEAPLIMEQVNDLTRLAGNAEVSTLEKLEKIVPGLDLVLSRLERVAGGHRFPGNAISPNGEVISGNFAMFGPIVYFYGSGGQAGLVTRSESFQPALVVIDEKAGPAIQSFVTTGTATLPIDPSQGRALAIRSIQVTPLEQFEQGGIWMWPIGAFGLAALLIAAYKLQQLTTFKTVSPAKVDEVLQLCREGKDIEARRLANKMPLPGGLIVEKGVANRRLPKELLEEFLLEILLNIKPKLESFTFIIALTAAVSPLLGLLGTVTGMIRTFSLLTLYGTGDAKSLSSGISEALLTTAFGLIAAIPALILAAIIGRMASAKLASLEGLLSQVTNGMAAIEMEEAGVIQPPSAITEPQLTEA